MHAVITLLREEKYTHLCDFYLFFYFHVDQSLKTILFSVPTSLTFSSSYTLYSVFTKWSDNCFPQWQSNCDFLNIINRIIYWKQFKEIF